MDANERTLLLLAGAALAAVVVWRMSGPLRQSALTVVTGGTPIQAAGISQDPTAQQLGQGPSYLVYNAPWAFAPPVGNVLPTQSVGQVGQVASSPPNYNDVGGDMTADCGCYG